MGFRPQNFATVWSVEERNGLIKVRLSTSRKNKDTGEYEQDFAGFCNFVHHAKAKASKLRERDRIRLGDVDVTTKYDKELKKEYVNYTVFDFEWSEGKGSGSTGASRVSAPPTSNHVEGDTDEEELPF